MDKLIVLGDTHGRRDWEKIIKRETFDKLVFIGDYFDAHEAITPEQQKDNFERIIEIKKQYPEEVVLLFGNHDLHYLIKEHYSGYQEFHAVDIKEMLQKNLEYLQACYVNEKYLFVHAGITKTWCKNNKIKGNIAKKVNQLFKDNKEAFGFKYGDQYNPYGDEICQSPFWVRPYSLRLDRIEGFTQVVGHTIQNHIEIDEDIIFIDALGSREYLVIKNNLPEVRKY